MGLTGIVTRPTRFERGDDVEIEFPLGDLSMPVRAVARVAWTSKVRPDGRLGFGVQFRELAARAKTALERYIGEHRPHVLVALPNEDERELAEHTLGHLDLQILDTVDDLTPDVLRACASLILFSHDADQLTAFLETLWKHRPDVGIVPGELPLAPITLCTSIDSELLLPYLGCGRVYEVLRPPFDRRMLALAAERSCERWALQLEVRWASLQLEGMAAAHQESKPVLRDPEIPKHGTHIVRASSAMERVYELIRTVAIHDVPVLLTGETGTGKELAAREIHVLSKRARTMFVAQDCGALTETLLESELFGHVRGAFTGATNDHPGLFQIANGGTIFLDEIQNTSPTLQAKLLRVVEQGEVRPVGGAKPRQVDVRLIAACNVDLRQAVKEQRFRADFYYRLNRFPIELPPLREHREDIVPLTQYFVATICKILGRPIPRVDPRVEAALVAHDWPGNIRELKNTIERALLLTPADEPLRWETLPDEVRKTVDASSESGRALDEQVAAFERRLIAAALERNDGVIRRAARELAVNAVTLSRKMKRLGLTGVE
jgi:DNA-binding NtrC family response regulator